MISKVSTIAGAALAAWSLGASAAPLKAKDLSPERKQAIIQHQTNVLAKPYLGVLPAEKPARPVSEVEEAGYLFFSADTNFNSYEAKQLLAKHLPAGVTLVIFAEPGANKAKILKSYEKVIDVSRIRVIEINDASSGFWARDGLPIPVWSKTGAMDLVDSRYYHGFEPDKELQRMFGSYLYKNEFYYEGGNFMANDRGDCLMVDTDEASQIPDDIFTDMLGCQRTIRFPFEKGIGHIDETVRFLKSNLVVTDSKDYAATLRNGGFEVLMLPRPNRTYETYVNAMLVNDTVYVPVYNEAKDNEALDVYRSAGLKVIPIESIELSNEGLGSIHCIVFAYPKVPFNYLLARLGAKEIK